MNNNSNELYTKHIIECDLEPEDAELFKLENLNECDLEPEDAEFFKLENLNKSGLDLEEIDVSILFEYGSDIISSPLFMQQKNFIQHGSSSLFEHCIFVALKSINLARNGNHEPDYTTLVRGALLHDYYLYDWHEKNLKNKIHGYTHPSTAAKNAFRDFNVSDAEKHIIKRHMFPLTPIPPTSYEAKVVCLADKICAAKETLHTRQSAVYYNAARTLAATFAYAFTGLIQ